MCNNNAYGVNFLFNFVSKNPETNKNNEVTFTFGLFPYSNVAGLNADFPICFKDKNNHTFDTMYANKPKLRVLTQIEAQKNPSTPKEVYFKIANMPCQVIPRKNLSFDKLMKLNKTFFKHTIVFPTPIIQPKNFVFFFNKNKKN
jgi:hypothetical protein